MPAAFAVLDNGEIHEISWSARDPFEAINLINDQVRDLENDPTKRVVSIEIALAVPKLTRESQSFLQDRLGVKFRRGKSNKTCMEISAAPAAAYTSLLAIFSAADFGERMQLVKEAEVLNPKTDAVMKSLAQRNIKEGVVRQECVLIKKIAELNGGVDDNQVCSYLGRFNREQIRDMLKVAYKLVFEEEFPDGPKSAKKELFTMKVEKSPSKMAFSPGGTTPSSIWATVGSTQVTQGTWNLE